MQLPTLFLTLTMVCLAADRLIPPGINPKLYQVVPEQLLHYKPLPYYDHYNHQQDLLDRQQVLTTGNLQQERPHIQEHMPIPIDTSQMSDPELQFHYFTMYDVDNNNKLDGCELLKSLIHWHNKDSQKQTPLEEEERVLTDEELAGLIDPILQMDDTSNDGYIDYLEFVKSQERKQKLELEKQKQKHKQAVH